MRRSTAPVLLAAGGVGLLLLVAAASPRAEARVTPNRAPALGPHPPLPGQPRAGSPFGWRTDPFTKERAFHRGLDIPVPVGTPVYAPWDAVVARIDRDGVGKGVVNGNAVILRVGEYRWAFLHLSRVAVQAGAQVQRGQLLGHTGQTGRATGPHLHLQVYGPDGTLRDPRTLYAPGTFSGRAP